MDEIPKHLIEGLDLSYVGTIDEALAQDARSGRGMKRVLVAVGALALAAAA